jgi:hypothetical protein
VRGPLAEGLSPAGRYAPERERTRTGKENWHGGRRGGGHSRKSFGGAPPELRRVLALEGATDPLWYEVKKATALPKYARQAAAKGADVVFVWGSDRTVQRCIDAVAGTDTAVAILPG